MTARYRLLSARSIGSASLLAGLAGVIGAQGASTGSSAVPVNDLVLDGNGLTSGVAAANDKVAGYVRANGLAPRLLGKRVENCEVVRGAAAVENPTLAPGAGVMVTQYGYLDDGPDMPAFGSNVEASKTEPDKNAYLVLTGQHGADPLYDYGSHFVFQGHELGAGVLTRVNLDADPAHKVTVLATADDSGAPLPVFDGSTWYPFSGVLLFTAEAGSNGGVWQATPDYPSVAKDVSGALGRGGYEGIQADSLGNLYLVEDVGGPKGAVNTQARQPNSFVYRFVPYDTSDLTQGGVLQALQVASLASPGQPIVFHAGMADADILSQDTRDLHTYGLTFQTRWVEIHDTLVDGFAPFDANALAKAASATPFKRPENGVFRPGDRFRSFFFTETGDTDAGTQAGAPYGGFGGIFELSQKKIGDPDGELRLFYRGDVEHTGFDNITFLTGDLLLSCEDAGDGLHSQRNALDSIFLFDLGESYGAPGAAAPVRILAEGRDASATVDSGLSGIQNEGDNEITGIHVSDGDPTVQGLFGVRKPRPFQGEWRFFWSQQHGDNTLWEVVARSKSPNDD